MPEEWLEANIYARVEVLNLFFGRIKMHGELLVKKKIEMQLRNQKGRSCVVIEFSFLF